MKIVCAWCDKNMGGEGEDNKSKEGVSHSICKECLATMQAKKRIKPCGRGKASKAPN